MSFFKVLILLPSVWLFDISFSPPNPRPMKSERVRGPFYEAYIGPIIFPILMRVSGLIPCIAEVVVTLAAHISSPLSSEVLSILVLSGHLPRMYIDHYFIVGSILVAIGGLGRVWCYHTMGRNFTYEIAILKGHSLVTTGPYAIVRHPSYLFAGLGLLGMSLMVTSPGSFARQCGWLGTMFGMLAICALALQNVMMWLFFGVRCLREDILLRERFHGEWEKYAQLVRYRIVPRVF